MGLLNTVADFDSKAWLVPAKEHGTMELNRRAFLASATVTAAGLSMKTAAQDEKIYRACVIGDSKQGGYGHHMHLAFDLHDRIKVVGLADPDEEGRAKHATEAGAENTYADYKEMLEKEKPDIVAVTPRWTVNHRAYIEACAAVGAHGFLEKPLCVDLAEADAIVDAVEAKNLKWAIAYNFRKTAIIQHVKKMMWDEKLIGTIVEIRSRGKEDHRAGAEDLIVLGTHLFDMMRYFMDDPLWCQSDITHNGKVATAGNIREATEPLGPIVGNRIAATFGFKKGVPGYFNSMRTREGNGGRWGIDICGTKGIISIRTNSSARKPAVAPTPEERMNSILPEVRWLEDSGWSSRMGADGAPVSAWKSLPDTPEVRITDPSRDRHAPIVEDLVMAIEEDREPTTSIQDGRGAQEMIQSVFEAYVQGKRVTFPLENRAHPLKNWT
jgi:predicted dehydrogenase